MYYIISILLIATGIGMAMFGSKKFNISLSIGFIVPNLAFLFYLSEAMGEYASGYIKYGYYAVLIIGVLILLFAKFFTYVYSYFTISAILILMLATVHAIFDIEEVASFEGWAMVLIPIVILFLIRKFIKAIVIGLGSGYMIGIGVAAIGFSSIIGMGWTYVLDAIYFPAATIVLFTIGGLGYQYYLSESEAESPTISKKQVNLYFGGGASVVAILLIILPLLMTTSPEANAKDLAKAYCECITSVQNEEDIDSIEDHCKNGIGYASAIGAFTSFEDVNTFTKVFTEEISNCFENLESIKTIDNEIVTKPLKETEFLNKAQVTQFINDFYSSLELTNEEYESNMENDIYDFHKTEYLNFFTSSATYSKERVQNLTGDYHDKFYIELEEIKSINIEGENAEVIIYVLYQLYETGSFYNEEKLTLNLNENNQLKLTNWEDLNLIKMEVSEYDHLANFSENDFYSAIGSSNKN